MFGQHYCQRRLKLPPYIQAHPATATKQDTISPQSFQVPPNDHPADREFELSTKLDSPLGQYLQVELNLQRKNPNL